MRWLEYTFFLALVVGLVKPVGLYLARVFERKQCFLQCHTIVAMLAGRFGLAALALALAGRFTAQGRRPTSLGTLPSDTVTFGVLVLGTIVLVGALSFLPALVLGPIVELLQL